LRAAADYKPNRGSVQVHSYTTNEMLTYDLNPRESRERIDEGMELILRAWMEPEPFGWQGRHFHYRTVSVWPKPLQHKGLRFPTHSGHRGRLSTGARVHPIRFEG
jgi:alkanesulfonate monooxygenase SsuD/methylene tetrahydromethanopterin reductase-like flavin-dependent oxidoreductase (luciferase family)